MDLSCFALNKTLNADDNRRPPSALRRSAEPRSITAHHLDPVDGSPRTDALISAVEAFAARTR